MISALVTDEESADVLILLLALPWVYYGVRIVVTSGITFMRRVGNETGRRETEAVREMGLGFAGLVFAGLAISLGPANDAVTSAHGRASGDLVIALSAAMVAWVVANLGAYVWVAFLSSASITVSVGSLLIAVGRLTGSTIGAAASAALGLSWLAVLVFSVATARLFWKACTLTTGIGHSLLVSTSGQPPDQRAGQ